MEPVQPLNPHGTPLLRVLALLVFGLLIAVLSSLGTYWYLSNQMVQQNTQKVYQSAPTTTQDETANWQIFISKEGLKFKYPKKWTTSPDYSPGISQEIDLRSPNNFWLKIYIWNFVQNKLPPPRNEKIVDVLNFQAQNLGNLNIVTLQNGFKPFSLEITNQQVSKGQFNLKAWFAGKRANHISILGSYDQLNRSPKLNYSYLQFSSDPDVVTAKKILQTLTY